MENEALAEDSSPKNSGKKWILWLVIALGIFASFKFLPVDEWIEVIKEWIDSLGPWGPIAYILIYTVAAVFLLPGAALTPVAGFLFGLGWGTLWTIIASNLGANAAFLVGRYFARDFVSRKIEGNEKFSAIDSAVGREGWKMVGLTRLSPIFPFVLLNYAYGLTKVKWSHYSMATLIGMLPGTVMYVYIGYIPTLAGGDSKQDTAKIVVSILFFLGTVAATIFITRLATKTLKKRADLDS